MTAKIVLMGNIYIYILPNKIEKTYVLDSFLEDQRYKSINFEGL